MYRDPLDKAHYIGICPLAITKPNKTSNKTANINVKHCVRGHWNFYVLLTMYIYCGLWIGNFNM